MFLLNKGDGYYTSNKYLILCVPLKPASHEFVTYNVVICKGINLKYVET